MTLGRAPATIYWDGVKYYDSMRPKFMLPSLLRRGYPPLVLLAAIIVHWSPRVLRYNSWCSDGQAVSSVSVLGQATSSHPREGTA